MKGLSGWLLLVVVLIVGSAVIGSRQDGAEFVGSDTQAIEAVGSLQPDYRPWWKWAWKPSPEMASGLFALQAALGAGVLGYCLGFKRGRAARQRDRSDAGD